MGFKTFVLGGQRFTHLGAVLKISDLIDELSQLVPWKT